MSEYDFKIWLKSFGTKILVTLLAALILFGFGFYKLGWQNKERINQLEKCTEDVLTNEDAIWYVRLLDEKQKTQDKRIEHIEKKLYGESRGADIPTFKDVFKKYE